MAQIVILRSQESWEFHDTKTGRKRKAKPPSVKSMTKWVCDGIAKTPDGCRTEPDGCCEHGFNSWLILMGVC